MSPRKSKPRRPAHPLWLLERDGITNSGLSKWWDCPEHFALSYIDGLTPRKFNEALEFGSLFHLVHANRALLTPRAKRQRTPNAVTPRTIMAAYRDEAAQTHYNNRNYLGPLDHTIRLVDAVWNAYEVQYPLAHEPKFISREETFKVTHPVLTLNVPLCGKRDGLFQFGRAKQIGLWEQKTKSKIDRDGITKALKCDFQTLFYCWCYRKETGHAPAKIIYDVIKRPTLRVTHETLHEHYARVSNHALDRPADYFFRWHVEDLTDQDLDRFEREILMPTLRGFVRWWIETKPHVKKNRFDSELHYLNLNLLSNPYRRSDFYDLLVLGRRADYYQRSSAHPELDESPRIDPTPTLD